MIPLQYISSQSERVSVYHRLVNYHNPEDLDKIKLELEDRFGKIPESVLLIIDAIELKILAGKIYAGLIKLKDGNVTIKFSDEIRSKDVFHQNIMPGLLNMNETKINFSGDQENPFVHFRVSGETKRQQIEQAKIILHKIY